MAISRYATKLAGLYLMKHVDALRVDMIVDSISELFDPMAYIRFHEKNESVKAEKTEQNLETAVPKALKVLESMVQGKLFLGEKCVAHGLALFGIVTNDLKPGIPFFTLGVYPKLSVVVANVEALPMIAAYITK